MSENSKTIGDADSSNTKTKRIIAVLSVIVLVVLGFYLYKFRYGLSNDNGDWGAFGDYVGGILNPVIASFAFYLIAETYKLQKDSFNLQKTELEETRKLLKVSTDVQMEQLTLAALTALLNSNLTRIGLLKNENLEILRENGYKLSELPLSGSTELDDEFFKVFRTNAEEQILKNQKIIEELIIKNTELGNQINDYLSDSS